LKLLEEEEEEEEARVDKLHKRANMKKKGRIHHPTMDIIVPRCKEINLKQINKILDEKQNSSPHEKPINL
jgi:hypothetical protein